jgi:Oligoketide cyclase/lipid transport protein
VGSHPQFQPWTAAARIRTRTPFDGGEEMEADLVFRSKVFRERFGSRVTLWAEYKAIDTEYLDGQFKHMV